LLLIVAAIIILMAVVWIVFYLKSEKRKKYIREEMLQKEKEKLNFEPDPLEKATQLLASRDTVGFLKELQNVIWKKTAEKLSIPSASLSQTKVLNVLEARGARETAALFSKLVNCCESSLYIPGEAADDLEDLLTNTRMLFEKLNQV
jgi:hypothetical protein